jgi:Ser/Thr protein kinase RdoA (MazF antagonist)
LIQHALAQYPHDVTNIETLRAGNNHVSSVFTKDGRRYALRLHRRGFRTPNQTRSEMQYLDGLSARMRVPKPVPTRQGDWIAELGDRSGPRHATLLTWLPGRVRRPEGQGAGPRTLFQIGSVLAQIHNFSAAFEPPPGFDLPIWDADGIVGPNSPFNPGPFNNLFSGAHIDRLQRIQDRLEGVFSRIGRRPETFGVIHNDVILLNCLHHGRQTAVIDFDDCGFGCFLYDFGGILGNLKDYRSYAKLKQALLAGYRELRALPSTWDAHFDLMIAARHATSALWIAGRWRVGDVSREAFEAHAAYRFREIADLCPWLFGKP